VDVAHIDWIPAGTSFDDATMVFGAPIDGPDAEAALARVDLIVTGPHASAAFPEELALFVDPRFTRRLQYDFTDVSTSPIARRWAQLDPHVVYVEDPHPRAVRDANRPRPSDLAAGLREAFDRLGEARADERPSLAGVDAIRPVTFGYLPVYRRPVDDGEWARFIDALETAGSLGVDRYERTRDEFIERVITAKLRRLASLDPSTTSLTEWAAVTHLDVLSIHDTMNHTAAPDGAIRLERAPEDRLPNVVALSNRGDADGEVAVDESPGLRSEIEVPTMRPSRLRSIAAAYRAAFDASDPGDVAFNRPYRGGWETRSIGPRLRAVEPRAVVRTDTGPARRLSLGAWQNEFCREFLLGDEATARLMEPGVDWVMPPGDRVDWLAGRLRAAHDLVRRESATRIGNSPR